MRSTEEITLAQRQQIIDEFNDSTQINRKKNELSHVGFEFYYSQYAEEEGGIIDPEHPMKIFRTGNTSASLEVIVTFSDPIEDCNPNLEHPLSKKSIKIRWEKNDSEPKLVPISIKKDCVHAAKIPLQARIVPCLNQKVNLDPSTTTTCLEIVNYYLAKPSLKAAIVASERDRVPRDYQIPQQSFEPNSNQYQLPWNL